MTIPPEAIQELCEIVVREVTAIIGPNDIIDIGLVHETPFVSALCNGNSLFLLIQEESPEEIVSLEKKELTACFGHDATSAGFDKSQPIQRILMRRPDSLDIVIKYFVDRINDSRR